MKWKPRTALSYKASYVNLDAARGFPINVPAGVPKAKFRLSWREDWGNVPTNDLDLFAIKPSGLTSLASATENNPERVVVNNPAQGTWVVVISGFRIPTDTGISTNFR
jgi:hypothetical protein